MPRATHAEELEARARTGLTSVPEQPDLLGTEAVSARAIVLLLAAAGLSGLFVAAGRAVVRRRESGPEPPASASPTDAPSKEVEMAT